MIARARDPLWHRKADGGAGRARLRVEAVDPGAADRQRVEHGLTAVMADAGGSFPLTLYTVLVTARSAG